MRRLLSCPGLRRFLFIAPFLFAAPLFAGTAYTVANLNEAGGCSPGEWDTCLSNMVLTTSVTSIVDSGPYQTWNINVSTNGFYLGDGGLFGHAAGPNNAPPPPWLTGTGQIRVYNRTGDDTGFYPAQFASLDITGFITTGGGDWPNTVINADPITPSMGAVEITDAGGTLHVESFFDITTDFFPNDCDGCDNFANTDHYASADAPQGPAPAIAPEPSGFVLIGSAGALLLAVRRRTFRF